MKNKSEEAATRAMLEARTEAAEKRAAALTVDRRNTLLYNKCACKYTRGMEKSFLRSDCYEPNVLQRIHDEESGKSLQMVFL